MDDPDSAYRPSLGSLTGFTQANIPAGKANLAQLGWSATQLEAFLLNQSGINFPTADFVLQLEEELEAHLTDYNNPHRVTLDQIAGDFVSQVLGAILPGTPPDIPPFYSYDAVCALPLTDIVPASFTTTNLYRLTEGGVFVDPSTELVNVGTSYATSHAGIPLFSTKTSAVPNGWATQNGTPQNTTLTVLVDPSINYPFPFYQIAETAVNGTFGVNIPVTENLGTTYTLTVLLYQSSAYGSVVFSQPGNTADTMTVSLTDGSFTLSSAAVYGSTITYPNGVIRISFTYTTPSSSPGNVVNIVHLDAGTTNATRNGTANRPLFSIAKPVATASTVDQPTPIDGSQPAGSTPMVLDMSNAGIPTAMANVMLTIALDTHPTLSAATNVDATVLTFDDLTITRDQSTFYVKVGGTTQFTSTILEGRNILTVSYSPGTLIFKDIANVRQTAIGTFPPLSTSAVSLGPCAGYLRYVAFYALPDITQCVEYLTNA